jgi:hypothetical protein
MPVRPFFRHPVSVTKPSVGFSWNAVQEFFTEKRYRGSVTFAKHAPWRHISSCCTSFMQLRGTRVTVVYYATLHRTHNVTSHSTRHFTGHTSQAVGHQRFHSKPPNLYRRSTYGNHLTLRNLNCPTTTSANAQCSMQRQVVQLVSRCITLSMNRDCKWRNGPVAARKFHTCGERLEVDRETGRSANEWRFRPQN